MKEALKMALKALETPRPFDDYPPLWRAYKKTINGAITAIKEALAQPEQEPVAWVCYGSSASEMHDVDFEQIDVDALPVGTMLYPTPPQRKPLTDEQIEDCIDSANRGFNGRRRGPSGQQVTTYDDWKHWLARAIETAHGIKE